MSNQTRKSRLRNLSYVAAFLAMASSPEWAAAVNLIWDGGAASGSWGSANNWQTAPGLVDQTPVNGDSLFYTSTSNNNFGQTNNLVVDTQINGITFGVVPAGGTGGTSVGGFTIGGNRIVLTGDLLNSSSNPTATETLNFDIALSGATRNIFANATPALSNGGNTFDFTLGGVISGSSNLVVNLDANGKTRFTGAASNTYTGNTTILAPTSGNAASHFLEKSGGAVAIQGGTTVTMGSTGGTGQANLRMSANEQFGTSSGGVQMDFANPSGQWMRLDLKGTTQTLAGLNTGNLTTQGSGVVQNQGIDGIVPAGDATLKLIGSGNYVFNGHLRDQDNGGTTRKLNLIKEGTGIQTFAGSQIIYTGTTTINGGEIALASANVGRGNWTVNNGGILRGIATDSIDAIQSITVNAGGKVIQSGGSYQQFYNGGAGGNVLILNGGSVEATVAGHGNYGNFLLRGNVVVGGTQTSTISADFRMGDNATRIFNVADTGDASDIDLNITGNFSHFNGITWGFMQKTGAGTMRFASTSNNQVGKLTLTAGKVLMVDNLRGWGNGGIDNNATFEENTSVTVNYAQALVGTGTFIKSGAGLLRFNGGGQVIRQGLFNIQGGTLQNDNNSVNWSTNTGDMHIASGAIMDLYADAVFVDQLTGTGFVQNNYGNGSGFSGSGQFIEKFVVGVANGSSTFDGIIRNNSTNTAPANATARGGISLVKEGTGTFSLTNAGTNYTGTTSVNNGTLELINASGFNSATTVATGATLDITNTADRNYSGGFAITLNNGATLDNTNLNNWTVINGAVNVSGNTTINHFANATAANGRGLYLDGGLKGSGVVTINALNAGSGVNLRNNNSNFSGKIIVNGIASTTPFVGSGIGVGGNTIGLINADIELNGTMELLNRGLGWANSAPGDFHMGALSGTGVMVGNFTGGGETRVRLGNNNNSGLFSGTIANGIGNVVVLTKNGTGTQTFSGVNTYTGSTTIAAGTLALFGAGSIDNSPIINVVSGATFDVEGVSNYNLTGIQSLIGGGTINGNVITDAGSVISPGATPGAIGTLTFLDDLDINGILRIDVNGNLGGTTDLITVGGLLDVSGATLDFDLVNVINDPFYIFASYGSLAGQFSSITGLPTMGYEVKYNFQGNNIALVSIPEPATMSLLALGSLGLLRRRRVVG